MARFPEWSELSEAERRRVDAAADEAVRQGGLSALSAILTALAPFDGVARRALLRTLLREHFEACEASGGSLPSISDYLRHFPDESEQAVLREIFAEQLPTLSVEIVREIGRGAMGVVFEGRQNVVGGRAVAVKTLDGALSGPAFLWERLRQEVEVLAQLQNAHIVVIHEAGLLDGKLAFVMELADRNLEQLTGRTPQDQRWAAKVIRSLAMAVQAAHDHKRRLIHQDLKPSNILVFKDTCKIGDFGLFRSADAPDQPSPGRVEGSPGWLSPEQAAGQPIGFATDVWGLGGILFFLLTGSAPFPTSRDRINDVATGQPVAPSKLRLAAGGDPLDLRLEAIVQKCLAREPGQRYRRAIELAQDLQRFLDDEPVQAPLVRKAILRRRRNRVLSALALVTLMTVAGITIQQWRSAETTSKSRISERASVIDLEHQLGGLKSLINHATDARRDLVVYNGVLLDRPEIQTPWGALQHRHPPINYTALSAFYNRLEDLDLTIGTAEASQGLLALGQEIAEAKSQLETFNQSLDKDFADLQLQLDAVRVQAEQERARDAVAKQPSSRSAREVALSDGAAGDIPADEPIESDHDAESRTAARKTGKPEIDTSGHISPAVPAPIDKIAGSSERPADHRSPNQDKPTARRGASIDHADAQFFSRVFETDPTTAAAPIVFRLGKNEDKALLTLVPADIRSAVDADGNARFEESWDFQWKPITGRGIQKELFFTRTVTLFYAGATTAGHVVDERYGSCSREMANRYWKKGTAHFVAEPARAALKDKVCPLEIGEGSEPVAARFLWKGATRNHYEASLPDSRPIIWSLVPVKN